VKHHATGNIHVYYSWLFVSRTGWTGGQDSLEVHMERTMFSICRQTRDVLCFFLLKSKVTCLSCQPVKTQSLCRSWSKQTGKTWEEIQLGDRLDEPVQCHEQPRTTRARTCNQPIVGLQVPLNDRRVCVLLLSLLYRCKLSPTLLGNNLHPVSASSGNHY
jgi:hypothetical protein